MQSLSYFNLSKQKGEEKLKMAYLKIKETV